MLTMPRLYSCLCCGFLEVVLYRPLVSVARAITSGAHAVAELTHDLHVLETSLHAMVQHLLQQCSVASV